MRALAGLTSAKLKGSGCQTEVGVFKSRFIYIIKHTFEGKRVQNLHRGKLHGVVIRNVNALVNLVTLG